MKYRLNVFILLSFSGWLASAQDIQQKLKESFAVDKEVVIAINASHTNIVFETWNKNTVEVSAYIQGNDLGGDYTDALLKSWQVDATGSANAVTVNASAGSFWFKKIEPQQVYVQQGSNELRALNPVISDMLEPILENLSDNPMPSTLEENLAALNSEYQKFKKDENKYIQQWETQIKDKFGDDYSKESKSWTQRFTSNTDQSKMEVSITMSTDQLQNNDQGWRDEFNRRMQQWAEQLATEFSANPVNQNAATYQFYVYKSGDNTQSPKGIDKVIKIKMPYNANVRLNVRHGDINLPPKILDLKASLSHVKLNANEIDGDQTYIKASYSPVTVTEWKNGRLVMNYVKNCRIQKATNLNLNSDSSNIFIQQLTGKGVISGSFGAVTIANVSESFSTLDLVMQNSDFKLKLPEGAFNLMYTGSQSRVAIPKTLEANARRNFGNVFINGYQTSRDTEKVITINAKYSSVILQ
ncbi:hypothetical protein [Aquimarina brevivitae]|uniref:Adhesin domain-containing protein n=1 Tax=Aquimarina brevivitae TaxID=323412 RepID=A0A4Q7PK92_9FLAO|nr:hypothetical protein [Aquimarina brevivitae]RZT00271.1 hypothetical protein EV197_1507 [Aquimarina brevivitae]